MAHALPLRRRVEIPLPSKPRDYRPGDGPALAPICISLAHDTGAFIIDKRVLPGKPINGELKLELYYVVGWPDLPAARVAILATKILDYVSPRTLEDWEYKCSLERDEEREKQATARKRRQEERTHTHMTSTPATGTSTPTTPGQKRRGRPSKAEILAHRLAQQASFGDDELANVSLPPVSTNGPSLSTPKKGLAQAQADANDSDEMDTNEAISRQLQQDSESGSESNSETEGNSYAAEEGLDGPDKPQTGGNFTPLDSFLPGPSSRGYAEFPVPNPPSSTQHVSTRSVSPITISLPPSLKKNPSSLRRKTQLTPIPVPSYPRPLPRRTSAPVEKTVTPVPAPSLPSARARISKQSHVRAITPIPAPICPMPKPQSVKVPHKPKLTPIPPPSYPPPRNPSEQPHKATSTPSRLPAFHETARPQNGTISTPISGWTPIDSGHREWLNDAEVEVKHDDTPPASSVGATSAAKSGHPRKRRRLESEEEPEWEVKRLEDDKVIETGGELVRYFKVRWAGEWPAGQNPTWEPEENISQDVILGYLRGKATNVSQRHSSPKRMKPASSSVNKKYSSVAEAVEGSADHLRKLNGSSLPSESKAEQDDDEEERFEVTEQTRTNTSYQKSIITPSLVKELAASFSLR